MAGIFLRVDLYVSCRTPPTFRIDPYPLVQPKLKKIVHERFTSTSETRSYHVLIIHSGKNHVALHIRQTLDTCNSRGRNTLFAATYYSVATIDGSKANKINAIKELLDDSATNACNSRHVLCGVAH